MLYVPTESTVCWECQGEVFTPILSGKTNTNQKMNPLNNDGRFRYCMSQAGFVEVRYREKSDFKNWIVIGDPFECPVILQR